MGHRAPYVAVSTLSVLTAHHWRVFRLKFVESGILNPMLLPTMHMILDMTEKVVVESMSASGGKDSEMKRSMFLDQLYAPRAETRVLNGDTYTATPAGFEAVEVEDSFDAFARAAG